MSVVNVFDLLTSSAQSPTSDVVVLAGDDPTLRVWAMHRILGFDQPSN
ncbi:MAG: hypothetical protein R3C05_24925 [Pirellulaceae bacterium]